MFAVYVEGQLTVANISAATEEAPYTEGFTSPQTKLQAIKILADLCAG
jgi:hypothetical protein